MNPDQPRRRRKEAEAGDTILVQFTAELLPPEADPYNGVRIGRPERSPSLPPDDEDRTEP